MPKYPTEREHVCVQDRLLYHKPQKTRLPAGLVEEKEQDEHRLKMRERQIGFGKNTLGYQRYLEMIPREKRKRGDPMTPDKTRVCSKRSWDGVIRKWRRQLHAFDPETEDNQVTIDLNEDVDWDYADSTVAISDDKHKHDTPSSTFISTNKDDGNNNDDDGVDKETSLNTSPSPPSSSDDTKQRSDKPKKRWGDSDSESS
eukprot:TRINITY_DN3575_c0_g1_i1.p1 TRINITY_DN3575_c0_g1~~TRINITY_DN3575_c0_g1_i1.p1  ORF type:complete len:200 (+),score=59.25 TRINITY_DN3575_c0_g1_i1:45-644(+)